MRGSVRAKALKRGGQQWYAIYDLPALDGRRRQKWEKATPNTRKAAEALLARRLYEREHGHAPPEQTTLAQLAEDWYATEVAPPARALNTAARVRRQLDNHLLPALGAMPVQQIRPDHVQALVAHLTAKGLGPDTVRLYVGCLRTLLLRAAERRLVAWDVRGVRVRYPPAPQAKDRTMRPLSADEAGRLVASSAPYDRALWLMALSCGLRRSELLACRWRHYDAEAGRYRVSEQVGPDRQITTRLKNNASYGAVAVSPALAGALEQQRAWVAALALKQGPLWHDMDLIFPGRRGYPLSEKGLWRRFAAALDRIGIERRRLHDLRHTTATLLLSQGAPVKAVQAQMRHATAALTLDTYAHLVPEDLDAAVVRLDGLLAKEAG